MHAARRGLSFMLGKRSSFRAFKDLSRCVELTASRERRLTADLCHRVGDTVSRHWNKGSTKFSGSL